MEKERFLIENFYNKDILEMVKYLNIDYYEYCDIVVRNKLYLKNTKNITRTWSTEEDDIIKIHSNDLTIRQISNMLWRSYYGTYQRIRYLGVSNLIKKRRTNKNEG